MESPAEMIRDDMAAVSQTGSTVTRSPRLAGAFLYLRSILALLCIWYAISLWVGNHVILPTPLAVAEQFVALLRNGEIAQNAAVSLWRLAVSYAIAGVVGIGLGIVMGLSALLDDLLDPIVEILRPISGIAWIPLALFIFGVGDTLPIFIMTYVAVFPFLLNTVAGVRATDPTLVRAARTLGVGRSTILRHVVLPSALPHILTGARIAGGLVWMALVAAELLGAPSGLGFAIEWYRELLMTPKVIAFIIVISILGYLTDRGLRALQRWLTPWATGIGDAP
jgi:ABC-type nitrate/sulfonate/bicarbonate transport system permease component